MVYKNKRIDPVWCVVPIWTHNTSHVSITSFFDSQAVPSYSEAKKWKRSKHGKPIVCSLPSFVHFAYRS